LTRKPEDLKVLDAAAMASIEQRRSQDRDNYAWIRDAEQNRLVVGTQARILYADGATRVRIALRFNALVRDGSVGPVMLGRVCPRLSLLLVVVFNLISPCRIIMTHLVLAVLFEKLPTLKVCVLSF
jgi:hypothetical protein